MTDPTALHYRPISDLAADLRAGRLSPVALTQAMLARIAAVDPALRSYLTVTAELALAQAAQAERELARGQYRGPLHGVPIAVKDLCFTQGIATSAGMAIHRDFKPDHDATVVTRLRLAGAVLLGKLHMTEGATLEHHPEMPAPLNPWGADLWPGVSSSGSGVATAAGLCFGSLGSDTGGSVRFPSSCNGLTGLKTTWGRVSRYGVFDLAPSYDTVGPMARSAEDVAYVMDAIAGWDPNDPTTLSVPADGHAAALRGVAGATGLRIGVDVRFNSIGADPEIAALTEAAASVFAALGAGLHDITFPDPSALLEHLLPLQLAELAAVHRDTFPAQADRYGPWLRSGIEMGLAASPVAIGRALIEREIFRGKLARLFTDIDAVLMPVLAGGTPLASAAAGMLENDEAGFFRYTAPLNAAGSPTVTLPCGFTQSGHPVGFQLVGAHCAEPMLMRAAHAFQQVTDFHLRRPVLN